MDHLHNVKLERHVSFNRFIDDARKADLEAFFNWREPLVFATHTAPTLPYVGRAWRGLKLDSRHRQSHSLCRRAVSLLLSGDSPAGDMGWSSETSCGRTAPKRDSVAALNVRQEDSPISECAAKGVTGRYVTSLS